MMDVEVLIKIIAIYFFILVIMKFMGKREIGQLSLFDFIVILIIADIAVTGIESDGHFWIYMLGIVALAIIQKILAFLGLKFARVRSLFDGSQSLIIIEGKLNIKEMKKQSYNVDDLIIQMRLKNIRSISEIRYLILESNGEISTFLFDYFLTKDSPPATNVSTKSEKMESSHRASEAVNKQSQPKEIYPFPVIVSGRLIKENIKVLNLTEEYVMKEIRKKGYNDVKDVIYANYEFGKLFIAQTCEF